MVDEYSKLTQELIQKHEAFIENEQALVDNLQQRIPKIKAAIEEHLEKIRASQKLLKKLRRGD